MTSKLISSSSVSKIFEVEIPVSTKGLVLVEFEKGKGR
jgi:hypothetical protein